MHVTSVSTDYEPIVINSPLDVIEIANATNLSIPYLTGSSKLLNDDNTTNTSSTISTLGAPSLPLSNDLHDHSHDGSIQSNNDFHKLFQDIVMTLFPFQEWRRYFESSDFSSLSVSIFSWWMAYWSLITTILAALRHPKRAIRTLPSRVPTSFANIRHLRISQAIPSFWPGDNATTNVSHITDPLTAERDRYKTTSETLSNDLDKSKAKVDLLNLKLRTVKEDNTNEVAKLKDEHSRRVEALRAELKKEQEHGTTIRSLLKEKNRQLGEAGKDNLNLKCRNRLLALDVNDARILARKATQGAGPLQEKLNEKLKEAEEYASEVWNGLQKIKAELSDSMNNAADVQKLHKWNELELQDAERALTKTEDELRAADKEIEELKNVLGDDHEQIEELKDELEDAEEEIKKLKDELEDADEEIKKLKAEAKETHQEALEQQKESLESLWRERHSKMSNKLKNLVKIKPLMEEMLNMKKEEHEGLKTQLLAYEAKLESVSPPGTSLLAQVGGASGPLPPVTQTLLPNPKLIENLTKAVVNFKEKIAAVEDIMSTLEIGIKDLADYEGGSRPDPNDASGGSSQHPPGRLGGGTGGSGTSTGDKDEEDGGRHGDGDGKQEKGDGKDGDDRKDGVEEQDKEHEKDEETQRLLKLKEEELRDLRKQLQEQSALADASVTNLMSKLSIFMKMNDLRREIEAAERTISTLRGPRAA